jgi:DNA-binding phage protein
MQLLSIKIVFGKVFYIHKSRQYFLDFEKDATKQISSQFLLSVIKKLNPEFLSHTIHEIERTKQFKILAKNQQLKINSVLSAILRKSN